MLTSPDHIEGNGVAVYVVGGIFIGVVTLIGATIGWAAVGRHRVADDDQAARLAAFD